MARTTTALLNAWSEFFSSELLPVIQNKVVLHKFADRAEMPDASGDTIKAFKYSRKRPTMSSGRPASYLGASGDADTPGTPSSITGYSRSKTLEEFGDFSKHSRLVTKTHIDRLKGVVEIWSHNMAETIEILIGQEIIAHAFPIRADLDAGKVLNTFATGTPTLTTIIVSGGDLVDAGWGDANDDLNQSWIAVRSGDGHGEIGVITDSVTDAANPPFVTLTIAGLEKAPASGDQLHIVSPDTLSSANTADRINTTALHRAIRILDENGAMTDNGFYNSVVGPEQLESLKLDTEWKILATESAAVFGKSGEGIIAGRVIRFAGVEFHMGSQPARMSLNDTTNLGGAGYASGVAGSNYIVDPYAQAAGITSTPIFGKRAFAAVPFDGIDKNFAPQIIVKKPGPTTMSEPLNLNWAVGWYMAFAAKMQTPFWCTQVLSAEKQI